MRIAAVLLLFLAAAAGACTPAAAPVGGSPPEPAADGAAEEEFVLTVLHTNDTHGRPLAFERGGEMAGGLAARKTAVDILRKQHPGALLLDAGDVCDGMPISNMNGAEPDFAGMALLGYDAMAVGNHEFSHDLEAILRLQDKAGFPFLCANLVREEDGVHPFAPHVIAVRGGRRIAVLGLITPELGRMAFKKRLRGLTLLDPLETAREWVPKLRREADHVIVVSHCGYGYDTAVLAPGVAGIDLIVGGHSHSLLLEPERLGDTIVVQAGSRGLFLGLVTLRFEGAKLVEAAGGLIPINFTPPDADRFIGIGPLAEDAAVLALLKPYEDNLSGALARIVGRVNAPPPAARDEWRDWPFGNLVADALRAATGADCAIQNAGGIRTRLGPGRVTAGDVMAMLPFQNNVIVVRLKGAALRAALEHALFAVEERPRIAGCLSGIEVELMPEEKKLSVVLVGGEPLVPERVYSVAVNSFMLEGGDGYVMLGDNEGAEDAGFLYSEALIRYLEEQGAVTPAADGRIRVARQ